MPDVELLDACVFNTICYAFNALKYTQHSIVQSPVAKFKLGEVAANNLSPLPSKYIDPVPYFTTEVLTCALPTVSKLFFIVPSTIPALVKLRRRLVFVVFVGGAAGTVSVVCVGSYAVVPLSILKPAM